MRYYCSLVLSHIVSLVLIDTVSIYACNLVARHREQLFQRLSQ
jgi:hypothetical protein